jgi:hypothetical protein
MGLAAPTTQTLWMSSLYQLWRFENVVPPGQQASGYDWLYVPPYSPALQPAERLWRLSDEALVNRHFVTLAELAQAQEARCRVLHTDPERIKASTSFWWWPQAL